MKKTVQAVAMSRVVLIDYYWRCQSFKKGIPNELAEALDESAMERILEMMAEGYVSGELNDNVNLDIPNRKTPEDGWECSGWWNLKKIDEPTAKLNTVNVIEMRGDAVVSMASFEDSKEGNLLAESRFTGMMVGACDFKQSKQAVARALEDGIFELGEWKILIVHSTEPTK